MNKQGVYSCACEKGFRLAEDNRTCIGKFSFTDLILSAVAYLKVDI